MQFDAASDEGGARRGPIEGHCESQTVEDPARPVRIRGGCLALSAKRYVHACINLEYQVIYYIIYFTIKNII